MCPLYFKLKHLDRIKTPGSAAMNRGSDIHKEGELYLRKASAPGAGRVTVPKSYSNFADQMKELAKLNPTMEQQWGFTREWAPCAPRPNDPHGWFAKDTWLRIVCDVSVVYPDGTAEVIDFKTGRMYDTNEEQVELFSGGSFMKFPNVKKVTARLWYLDVDGDNEVIREYTDKDFAAIKKDWEKKIRPMFNDRKFAPTPNRRCGTCHFRKDNGGPCKF
jgi:hypothetical protein